MNYKKIFITMCFVVLLSSVVQAQLYSRIGVKGGVNFSKFTGDDIHDPESKMGYIGGVFMAFELSDNFFLQPEVLYTMKGCKFSGPGWDATDKLDYLEIPVLVKYVLSTYGNTNPYVLLGPAFGFNLSATYEYNSDDGDEEGDWEDIAPLDVGIVFGLGVDISRVLLELRYTMGVSSIDDSGEDYNIKNGVVSLMAGVNL